MRVIHIMIVEDEKPIRTGIRHMLEEFFAENAHLHYEIAESSSGRDAYRRCTSGVVDILITDIKMPAMSGISLAKKLVREQLPIHMLAVSGYQDYEYVREMMKLGVHDYLIKPIDRAQLYESMEYFVTHLYAPQSREKESMLAEQRMVERILLGACDSHKELDQYLARRGLDRNVPCEVLLIREDPTQREQPFGLYYALCARFGEDPNLALVQGELDGSWVVIAAGSGLTEAHVNALADQIARAGHSVTARLGPVALRDANSLNAQHRLSFYDLLNPPLEGLDARTSLDQIVEVMAGAERPARLEEAVSRLFAAYQAGKAPADSIKKDVSGLMYQLMSKCADYIEFIGKTRFTRYDLMECFEDASSLSEIKKGRAGGAGLPAGAIPRPLREQRRHRLRGREILHSSALRRTAAAQRRGGRRSPASQLLQHAVPPEAGADFSRIPAPRAHRGGHRAYSRGQAIDRGHRRQGRIQRYGAFPPRF